MCETVMSEFRSQVMRRCSTITRSSFTTGMNPGSAVELFGGPGLSQL